MGKVMAVEVAAHSALSRVCHSLLEGDCHFSKVLV